MTHGWVATVLALLAACTSTSSKVEETWNEFAQRQQDVIAHWETAPLDEATRRDHAMPDANPVARVAELTVFAGLAYVLEDLPALERALRALEDCDAEIAGLEAARGAPITPRRDPRLPRTASRSDP